MFKCHLMIGIFIFFLVSISSRGVCGSVGSVFSQICYRTDRDRFFHNKNRCILLRIGFRPIAVRFLATGLIGLVGLKH